MNHDNVISIVLNRQILYLRHYLTTKERSLKVGGDLRCFW